MPISLKSFSLLIPVLLIIYSIIIQSQMSSPAKFVSRTVAKSVQAIEQGEGVGVTVRRSIGTPRLRNLSPFLMLE